MIRLDQQTGTPGPESHAGIPARGTRKAPGEQAGLTEPPAWFARKYAIDRLVGAILLVPALPLIGVLALAIRLTSRGPAIYRQNRVGLDGRVYEMLKLRSMRIDAEVATGPRWCAERSRITRIGRWLRLLHLDELPQLFNVVRGDMAIIGPRPERPEIVDVLRHQVENYRDRLVIKPGITGLAQIYLPPDQEVSCVRRKVCLDRAYIENASPIVDLQIWLCTIVRIIGVRRGIGPRLFGLDRRFASIVRECKAADLTPASFTQNRCGGVAAQRFAPKGARIPAAAENGVPDGESSATSNGHARRHPR